MNKRRILVLASLALVFVLALSACAAQPAQTGPSYTLDIHSQFCRD